MAADNSVMEGRPSPSTARQRPANLEYGVDDRPPALNVALLGFQYACLLSVYLVIIVIVVRAAGASGTTASSAVSFGMIAAAIATVLQALPRGPVGSGFMAPPVFSAIYLGPSILAAQIGGLPAVFAMTIFAGLVEIILSRLLHRLRIIIQPTMSGLTVCVVGLQLGIVGMQQALDVAAVGSPEVPNHFAVAAITLATCIGLTIWGRGAWRLVSSLAGLLIGVVAAILFGIYVSDAGVRIEGSPWFALPSIDYIEYSFEPSLIPAFLAAGLAATLRTVGVVTTCQKMNDTGWTEPDTTNIRKGVLADGLGCMIGGFLGTPGMNIAPSLVGVSLATGVTSRVIAYACAAVLLLMAFIPKIAAVFLTLPMPVAGALLVFTASLMIVSGLQLMLSKTPDTRSIFVIGIGILTALVHKIDPEYFARLPHYVHAVADSTLSLSLGVAIILTLLFRIGMRQQEVIAWKKSDDALGRLRRNLIENAQDWRLSDKTIKRCMANVEQVLRLLMEGRLIKEPLSITVAPKEKSVEIELHYHGLPLTLPDLSSPLAEPNEEESAMAGLHRVAIGVYPDRSTTLTRGAEVTLRLSFDLKG